MSFPASPFANLYLDADNPTIDPLHIRDKSGNVIGGIDSTGAGRGTLATASSGPSATQVSPNTNEIFISQNCPSGAPNCFQAYVDGQFVTDATFTSGSKQVTTSITDPPFTSADVGKVCFGTYNCEDGTAVPCFYALPQGTITAFIDAHNVLVSKAATHSSVGGTNTVFIWGHDDGAQIAAAFAATIANAANGPSSALKLPCGTMLTGTPPFIVSRVQASCAIGVSGCGGGGTMIIPLPLMNCTGPYGCLISDSVDHIENPGGIQSGAHFRDITFYGGGIDAPDSGATYTNGVSGIYLSFFDLLTNVWVNGWNWNDSTHKPIGITNIGAMMVGSGSYAGGYISCFAEGAASTVASIFGGTIGGSSGNALLIGSGLNGVSTYAVYMNAPRLDFCVINGSGLWNDFGSFIGNPIESKTGGVSILKGSTLAQESNGNSVLTMTGGTVHLDGVNFICQGAMINMSGGSLFDDGGNIFTGTTPSITGGNVFGDASITGVPQISTNVVLTSGWGTGASVSTVSGDARRQQFTITAAGTPGSNPVLTVTFPNTLGFLVPPICSIIQISGTIGDITSPAIGAPTITSVAITFAGTPVAGHTYTFVLQCGH